MQIPRTIPHIDTVGVVEVRVVLLVGLQEHALSSIVAGAPRFTRPERTLAALLAVRFSRAEAASLEIDHPVVCRPRGIVVPGGVGCGVERWLWVVWLLESR